MQHPARYDVAARLPLFAPPEIQAHWRPDGSMVLRSKRHPGPAPEAIGHWLEHWGSSDPSRPFLAAREPDGSWRRLTYGQALAGARAIGQSLLDRRLDAAKPIVILADNGIDHALLMLGAMHVGHSVAPVSTAYARLSQDFAKLRHIVGLVEPALVYVDDAERYQKALTALDLAGTEIIASRGTISGYKSTPFGNLLKATPGPAVADALAAVRADTLAKVLFTSGSTGNPKGVINTHGMLVQNQASLAAAWTFLDRDPPRLVDWLPWNHTFGGNHNFNMVLRSGGSMLIDEGRPMPGMIERTVANLKEASPSLYFNVPRGYGVLLDHLERDEALQTSFFDQLQLMFYAGAALPQALWDRLEKLSVRVLGHKVPLISGWGATETAPVVTSVHFTMDGPGNIGVPLPGTTVKLVPEAGKLAIVAKGPNITPGYFREPLLTAQAFDAEGWLLTGDAVRLADPQDPGKGIVFDGRIAESFKLSTGTWVNVGVLRSVLITALAPFVEDCVITGHDGDEIGLLLFPNAEALRETAAASPGIGLSQLCRHPAVLAALRSALQRYNTTAGGSSERIGRAVFLAEPPSLDAGEITDKGYLNQRAVLERRRTEVAALHATSADPGVIVVA